jgi:hypothetical protein
MSRRSGGAGRSPLIVLAVIVLGSLIAGAAFYGLHQSLKPEP